MPLSGRVRQYAALDECAGNAKRRDARSIGQQSHRRIDGVPRGYGTRRVAVLVGFQGRERTVWKQGFDEPKFCHILNTLWIKYAIQVVEFMLE